MTIAFTTAAFLLSKVDMTTSERVVPQLCHRSSKATVTVKR